MATTTGRIAINYVDYEGELVNGIRHGWGISRSSLTNTVYMGDWIDGMKHGYGVQYNSKKRIHYNGEWRAGMRHGQGTCLYPSNDVYTGEWNFDKCTGYGTLYSWLGWKHVGYWKNAFPFGRGTRIEKDIEITGDWTGPKTLNNACLVIFGRFRVSDITCRIQDYELPKANFLQFYMEMIVSATIEFGDGNVYRGDVCRLLPHGNGIITYPDGSIYKGRWQCGNRHGYGTIYDANPALPGYNVRFVADKLIYLS